MESDTASNTDPNAATPRFFWQVYSVYGVLIAFGGWFFGYLLCERFTKDTFYNFEQRMTEQAQAFSSSWSWLDEKSIIATIENNRKPQLRIDLLNSEGTEFISRDNSKPSTSTNPKTLYPELSEFFKSDRSFALANFNLGSARDQFPSVIMRFYSAGNDKNYLLRIAQDPSLVISQIDSIFESVLLLGLIAALLAMVMGHLLYRRINRQFKILTKVAVAYSEGDFSARAPNGLDVESDLLGEALNKLADEIQEQVSEIHLEHNRMRVILGGMRDGLIAIDDLGKIVLINSVMSRILKLEIREAKGQYISDVVNNTEITELLLNTLRIQRPLEAELDLETGPNEIFLKAYTSPLVDYGQDVSGALIVLHDLSQTRQLENMRRDFVANVSHELKTPITAIRGIAETLLDDPDIDPEIRHKFTAKITDQSHRLSNLVSDLLALASLDEKKKTPRVKIDLGSLINERISSLSKVTSPENQAALKFEAPKEPIFVFGNEEDLRQAIGNLIDNGLKYTPAEGTIQTTLCSENELAIIEIRDNGIGIPEELLDRIFERFFRVDKARSREIGGTGLGLAIVKNVCLKHDGNVEVKSRDGQGTTFTITLPIYVESQQGAIDSHSQPA
ncbi:MAG: hypothetical protein CBC13_11490 [Planctomycetia bacterium TMED53]|nr:MAG: hypothetical protein CBC13_11490 [Planctomycetia bacterium TMED53]